MKKSEFIGRRVVPGSLAIFVTALALVSAFACQAGDGNGYSPILYPSIFWHNNQWETYENGQWVPYRGSANNEVAAEPELYVAPEPIPGPDTVDTNIYPAPYGWGFIGAPAFNRPHRHLRHERPRIRLDHRRPMNGVGQANAGIGRTTIGIGRPNVGIGQTTIGIGRPNVGMGQQNSGFGRTTIGIGQPNAGIGQTTLGIGQSTLGIGQPMSGQQSHSEHFRGR